MAADLLFRLQFAGKGIRTLKALSNRYRRGTTLSSSLCDDVKITAKAVIFDIGGVVIQSPFPVISQFEVQYSLPEGSINATIKALGEDCSFAKLERGELSLERFCVPFANEFSEYNNVLLTRENVWDLARGLGGLTTRLTPYKEVVDLMADLKRRGIKIGVITNNFRFEDGKTVLPHDELGHVDVVSN